jgi:hypothetical protein
MVIVCIAAVGGCASAPAPDRTAVRAKATTAGGPTWTELDPAASPPARDNASMAYDPATSTMLLFGGFSDSGDYLDDTWSWNGTTWIQLSPAASPLGRTGAPMAYDAATGTVLLFGGFGMVSGDAYSGEYGGFSDTWSWNGTTWTELSPASNPGSDSLESDSMAYDPATQTVVLFDGGDCNSCGGPGQTWSWNGTTWTRLAPRASPPASGGWSMAYDMATATVLLYGGMSYGYPMVTALDETWSWNGTTWTRLSPGPPPGGASMAYDPAMEAMLLVEEGDPTYMNRYSHLNDTWIMTDPSSDTTGTAHRKASSP